MFVSALSPRCHTTLQDVWDNLNSSPSGILDGLVRLHCHIIAWQPIINILTWQRSAVSKVSGCRYDPGVASSNPARSHTFVDIDHEIISTVILLPSADSRRVVVSYKQKYVHKVLEKKCG